VNRGKPLPMSHVPNLHLCDHKMNPKSCPYCYRENANKPRVAPQATSVARSDVPMGFVPSLEQALDKAAQTAARVREANAKRPAQAPGPSTPSQPHASGNVVPPPEAHSKDKLWEPPARRSIIDSLPTHPHANEGKMSVMKR
jgi:hypothetical protein